MRYYPVFLNLEGKPCLVVGTGQVGARKVASLLDAGAEVLALDLEPPSGKMAELLGRPALVHEVRPFAESDLDGRFLVIASTSSEEINQRISDLCETRGIPCNIVDQPDKCSFIVPAMFTQGDLTLAISTGGFSPALARKIREDLVDYFGKEYGEFLAIMGRLRPLVLELGRSTEENTALFRSIVESDCLDRLKRGDRRGARDTLTALLPEEVSSRLTEVMDGTV